MTYQLNASSILSDSIRRRIHKVVGVQTLQGHVFCSECATSLHVVAQETYYSDDTSDWSIICERCESTILELAD